MIKQSRTLVPPSQSPSLVATEKPKNPFNTRLIYDNDDNSDPQALIRSIATYEDIWHDAYSDGCVIHYALHITINANEYRKNVNMVELYEKYATQPSIPNAAYSSHSHSTFCLDISGIEFEKSSVKEFVLLKLKNLRVPQNICDYLNNLQNTVVEGQRYSGGIDSSSRWEEPASSVLGQAVPSASGVILNQYQISKHKEEAVAPLRSPPNIESQLSYRPLL